MKVILVLLKSGNLPHFSSGLKISEVPSTLPRVRCLEKVSLIQLFPCDYVEKCR